MVRDTIMIPGLTTGSEGMLRGEELRRAVGFNATVRSKILISMV